jgi:hypothetical protein
MRLRKRVFLAWGAGWAIYLVAAIAWGDDGLASLVLQPFCAAAVSTLAVAAVLATGLVLRLRPIGRRWHSGRAWAAALAVVSLGVLGLGSSAGLTAAYADPETGRAFPGLHPAAAVASYFGLMFALAHWPMERPGGATKQGQWTASARQA